MLRIGRLSLRTELAETSWQKFRGLMFRRDLDHALVFVLGNETRLGASIHALFCFFPFDIVWLGRDRRIVDARERVRPFTLNATPAKAAAYFVELPAGTIRKSGAKKGAKVSF
jgi:hypothetical protein